ncbi:MAG: thioredoxin family protein [Terracidiphilus sp.]|jgi:hypothetical protein
MRSTLSFVPRGSLAIFPLLAGLVLPVLAQAPAVQSATAALAPSHTPEVTVKMNTLAHRILNAGLKGNALSGDDLKPWHMRVDIQFAQPGKSKPEMATLEMWSMGPYQWKRTYSSREPHLDGSEWSLSRFEQYRSKPDAGGFNPFGLNLRATRPVVDPLYQSANIGPDYEMAITKVNKEGLTLTCVLVADPSAYIDVDESNPDYLFPAMCFDNEMHLRATSTADTMVQLDDIQPFQNRAVARDVKVIAKGAQVAEMKVTLLELWTGADAEQLKPGKGAVPEPYRIEAGHPKPESVHEEGFLAPPSPSGVPYRGVVVIPIVIKKDGSVKADQKGIYPPIQSIREVSESALNRWKYKPYLVDGQPVEVAFSVHYVIDGKPFVPSYERPNACPVPPAPEDFSSAYDPKRNPTKDLIMAEKQAKQANKRILMEVGGNWCGWCKLLDKTFVDHPDLLKLRDSNYLLMKVNMSGLNENYPFLSQYPKIPGYPWLFVLDADGKLLVSKNTDDLENHLTGYDDNAIKEFLLAWKP